jgi:tocopherol cyclase
VRGDLRFTNLTPWPVTLLSPGIMGPFAWIPWMECYHAIVSLDHGIHGALEIDGRPVSMDGGRGYTEKDWGKRFPAAWIWFQSNHLGTQGVSITASVALVPWLGSTFRGMIIGLWCGGVLYRFATYTGARIEHLRVDDEWVRLQVADRRRRLQIDIVRHEPGSLYAPDIADMSGRVGETLRATATVRLTQRGRRGASEATLYEGVARLGGLEVVGDMARLTSESSSRAIAAETA